MRPTVPHDVTAGVQAVAAWLARFRRRRRILEAGRDPRFACVECGDAIAPALSHLGSLRCHDCRHELGVRLV